MEGREKQKQKWVRRLFILLCSSEIRNVHTVYTLAGKLDWLPFMVSERKVGMNAFEGNTQNDTLVCLSHSGIADLLPSFCSDLRSLFLVYFACDRRKIKDIYLR